MDCKSCWWQEGGRCYTGEFTRDSDGRSDKLATARCDLYQGKRATLEQVIPGNMLVIVSEENKSLSERAREQGYNDAKYDGMDLSDTLQCKCEKCINAYYEGQQKALGEIFRDVSEPPNP